MRLIQVSGYLSFTSVVILAWTGLPCAIKVYHLLSIDMKRIFLLISRNTIWFMVYRGDRVEVTASCTGVRRDIIMENHCCETKIGLSQELILTLVDGS